MAIDFPNSPALDDVYTVGSRTWTWTGTNWELKSSAFGAGTVGTTELADSSVTTAKIAAGAAVSNIGYTPANVAGPTFTGTVTLPSTTSIGTVSSTEIGYVDGVTSAIQTQLDSKLTATTASTSNKNAIINGAMNVWQRGTNTGTLGVGGGSYTGPDRWWFYNNGFTTTMSQQLCGATLPQFRNCLRIQRTAGQTSTVASVFVTPQETINSVRFAGKVSTLSFYARASSGLSTATALMVNVFTGTGTDQSNFSGGAYTGLANPLGVTPTLTTSWQRFTATGTIASTATELSVQINFTPTGTAGASDYFEITGIQLEEGAVATPFEFEDYGTTLAKCLRYYYQSSGTNIYTSHGLMYAFSSSGGTFAPHLAVQMRTSPTSVTFSNLGVFTTGVLAAISAMAVDPNSNPQVPGITTSVSGGMSAGSAYRVLNNNSSAGYLALSAEL